MHQTGSDFMKLISAFIAATALVLATGAHADPSAPSTLSEGFDDISSMPGWVTLNESTFPGGSWFQGNSGIFSAHSGAPNSYLGANYLAAAFDAGMVDLWMMSPVLNLDGASELSFWLRSSGEAGYSDTIEVYFGAGSASDTASFTPVSASYTATGTWTRVSLPLAALGEGRIGLRYWGAASSASYVGIDSLSLAPPVPEPATYVMLCIGLAALFGFRHSRAVVACGAIAVSSAAFAGPPPPASGMVVVRDPATGQLRPPTEREYRALAGLAVALQAGQAATPPVSVRRSDGSLQRRLEPEAMTYSVVSRGKDGKLTIDCVSGEQAAKEAASAKENGHETR